MFLSIFIHIYHIIHQFYLQKKEQISVYFQLTTIIPDEIFIKKNHTHVKRWGTPQNFCLAFIDELQKQLFIYISTSTP